MSRAPGTYSTRSTSSTGGVAGPQTGKAFMVGVTERGPVDVATEVESIAEFEAAYGGWISGSYLWDSVDVGFREGCSSIVVARNIGDGAATASATVPGASGNTLTASAASPGEWGNDLDLVFDADGGNYTITVTYLGETVETSTTLATRDDAVTAFAESKWVRFTVAGGSGDPTDGSVSLSGGTNGTTSTTSRANALALFTDTFGRAGQVAVPGDTATACHDAIRSHCASFNRIPVCDYADASAATTAAALEADWGDLAADLSPGVCFIGTAPGGRSGATRQIPGSVAILALAAKSDATKVPGHALAADNGTLTYITGLVREYTEDERATINDAGGTVAILDDPDANGRRRVVVFSDRTVAERAEGSDYVQELSDARVLMAVEARLRFLSRPWRFRSLVQQERAALTGALTNLATDLYDAGVLSDGTDDESGTYADAFSVDVQMNKADREWVISAYPRPAKCGEVIQINLTRRLEA